MRHLRSNSRWLAGRFSSSTNIEPSEWLVLYDQTRYGDSLSNGLLADLPAPFLNDFVPGHAIIELFQDDPHHDSSTFERGLSAADFRVSHDVPSQFNPAFGRFSLHLDAPHYGPEALLLQANRVRSMRAGLASLLWNQDSGLDRRLLGSAPTPCFR